MEDQKPLEREEAVTDANKRQAQFWLEYGQQLSDSIRYIEALAALQRAVSLDDRNVEAWYATGTCLAMLARYEEALETFEHTSSLDPEYFDAQKRRSRLEKM